jgi:hypothetical protein
MQSQYPDQDAAMFQLTCQKCGTVNQVPQGTACNCGHCGQLLPTMQTQSAAKSNFAVGQILNSTFSMLFKKPVMFFGLAIIAGLPSAIFLIANGSDLELSWLMGEEDFALMALAGIIDSIFSMIMEAGAVYAVFRVLRKENVTIGQAYDFSKAREWPLFGAAVLVGLATGVGTLLFVIPGIILMLMLAMTIPACAVERLGVMDSMKRSANLTRGYRLPILGLYLISGLLIAVLGALFDAVLNSITIGVTTYIVISTLLEALPLAFEIVMTAMIYFKLRQIKEGMGLDHLAGSFELNQSE